MGLITVIPIIVKVDRKEDYFGDETGTPDFYMVSDTLKKYLGEESIFVSWDYNDFAFIIEDRIDDEGCDTSHDFRRIIENIYESFGDWDYYKDNYLKFRIVEENESAYEVGWLIAHS